MNELILAPIQSVPVALSPELKARCAELVAKASSVQSVADITEQAKAGEICREIALELKQIEQSRKEIKEPVLAIAKQIDATAKEASEPLTAESSRISSLVTKFHLQEQARVRAEQERIRLEQERIAREAAELELQAKRALEETADPDAATVSMILDEQAKEKMAELAASTAAPAPEPHRASGMVVRKVMDYEITDKAKVFAKWPHFFEVKERRSVILATISKDFECEGMRVWESTSTSFRAK